MVSKAEIQRWVRPIVAQRKNVILNHRALLVHPLHHVSRGVSFVSGRSSIATQVAWFMGILFAAPGAWNSVFMSDLSVGLSDREGYESDLRQNVEESLDNHLLRVSSIEVLYDVAIDHRQKFTFRHLDAYPFEQATVLASLGRLEEARDILAPELGIVERRAGAELAAGEALLSKRRNSARARDTIAFAREKMELAGELRRLLVLLEARDRPAIAALLHQWEHERVVRRGLEHLWEPTPFPVEQGAGG